MEHNTLELKSSWDNKFLRTICAFANTNGGTLEIGKNDKGEIIGLPNAKELLTVIPKTIYDTLAINVEAQHHTNGEKNYISITVTKQKTPIDYNGKFYKRSGANTLEVKGNELIDFILQTQGKTWDELIGSNISVNDLAKSAFETFRKKAIQSKRSQKEDLDLINNDVLLENLKLKNGTSIKRAAALCFGKDPEKYVTNAFVRIIFFDDDDIEIHYQDEVHGALIEMADKILDLLYTKYLKGFIRYEGIQRIEDYFVPREAMREAVLNAIVHNDYSCFTAISIRVYENKLIIVNRAKLPEHVSFKKLLNAHRSYPHNPLITNVFYRSGQIETLGRGISKIIKECKKDGKSKPVFKNDQGFFEVEFKRDKNYADNNGTINGGINGGIKYGLAYGLNEPTPVTITRDTPDTNNSNNKSVLYVTGTSEVRAIQQDKIVKLIIDNNSITIKQIAEELNVTERVVEGRLKSLKGKNIIRRSGSRKNGTWIVLGR